MTKTRLILCGLALVLFGVPEPCRAQVPMPPTVSVGFRNDTAMAIIVQGTSKINNVPRRGQPFVVAPGKINYDNNVVHGVRFITIYDAAQPAKILLANFPIHVQGREPMFSVVRGPLPGQVMLVPMLPPAPPPVPVPNPEP